MMGHVSQEALRERALCLNALRNMGMGGTAEILALARHSASDDEWAALPLEVLHGIGRWLSAALDDPDACQEFKTDINAFFDAMPD
jgi:hypothetical protein